MCVLAHIERLHIDLVDLQAVSAQKFDDRRKVGQHDNRELLVAPG